jgi:hypothetical protein
MTVGDMRSKERIEESVEERGSDTALCVAYILYIATLHIGESHDTLHYNTRGSYGLSIEDENTFFSPPPSIAGPLGWTP